MWIYRDDNNWVECELLHEFIDAYQIRYYCNEEEVEEVVAREKVREIENGRLDS